MEVGDGRSPARVVNDRVYVAVGRDVRESRSTLSWASNNFVGHFRIIHVHQPQQLNPSPRPFYGGGSRNPQELARREMESILDEYIHMCSQAGGDGTTHIRKGQVCKPVCASILSYLVCLQWSRNLPKVRVSPSLDSVHSRSNSSEVEDDLASVRYERGEGSNHITESNSVRAYEASLSSQPGPEEFEDDLALDRYERCEGSNHITESNSVRAYEASLSSQPGPEEPAQPSQYLICPISRDIMEDPHVAADGFTYEAEAIRIWLSGHDTSPMANLQLSNREIFPNQTVCSMIQEWLQTIES